MKQEKLFILLVALCFAGSMLAGAPSAEAQYETNGINGNVIYLTTGHTQIITFPLDGAFSRDPKAFHAALFLVLGSGKITVRVGTASAVGDFSNVTYSVVGFIGSSLIAAYGNDAETISIDADVNGVAIGVLCT